MPPPKLSLGWNVLNKHMKDTAQDVAEDVTEDVAKYVLGAAEDGSVKVFIVARVIFKRWNLGAKIVMLRRAATRTRAQPRTRFTPSGIKSYNEYRLASPRAHLSFYFAEKGCASCRARAGHAPVALNCTWNNLRPRLQTDVPRLAHQVTPRGSTSSNGESNTPP